MNEKTTKQIEEMMNQTIGVEVEMNNITRTKAAQLAAEFFGTARHEHTAGRNGYDTYSAWDGEGREWKFQKDVSIAGPDSEKCEMVTPILTYKDIETLQELIRRLRKAGAKSDATRGCGVHIHIGAKGHTPQSLRNLANIMASHESLLASALNLDRSRMNRYCRTVSKDFLVELNRKKPKTMAALADTWYGSQNADYGRSAHYNESRYHMLNLHATFTRARLNSDFSSLTRPRAASRTDFTQVNSNPTFSFVWRSASLPSKSRPQAQILSRLKTPSTQCGLGYCGSASSVASSRPQGSFTPSGSRVTRLSEMADTMSARRPKTAARTPPNQGRQSRPQ